MLTTFSYVGGGSAVLRGRPGHVNSSPTIRNVMKHFRHKASDVIHWLRIRVQGEDYEIRAWRRLGEKRSRRLREQLADQL